MASVTLDRVTCNDAQPASPAVHLEDRTVLSYGELAELIGESERALRHDGKALVLSSEILSEYQPEFVVPAPGSGTGLADLGYRPAAERLAGGAIFQRKQPASR